MKRDCVVCGAGSDGVHFGVMSCRACAAFFRRACIRKRSFKCQKSTACQLTPDRKHCQSCRFDKCMAVGMDPKMIEHNRDKIGSWKADRRRTLSSASPPLSATLPPAVPVAQSWDQWTPPQTTAPAYQEEPCCSSTPLYHHQSASNVSRSPPEYWDSAPKTRSTSTESSGSLPTDQFACMTFSADDPNSLLSRMRNGVASYRSAQRSLFTLLYPGCPEVYEPITHAEHVRMQRGTLSLVCAMLRDWFPPFADNDFEVEKEVALRFGFMFSLYEKCVRTAEDFPDPGDTRYAMHHCRYMDSTDMTAFFKSDPDPLEKVNHYRMVSIRLRRVMDKVSVMRLRASEQGALTGIMLWNEMEMLSSDLDLSPLRDRVFAELHADILNHVESDAAAGQRMGTLICLLNDIQHLAKELQESITICKLFSPHSIEMFDD